jgi:spermidine dehydrogenase
MPTISRRDFLNGIACIGMAQLGAPLPALAASLTGGAGDAGIDAGYPPALTGLRGSHIGSFERAHALALAGERHFGELAAPAERYDLVVIGAGISGLAAAFYYREQINSRARILILDNHDDFGGHARRCEFTVDGQWRIGYGGTQAIDAPQKYSRVAATLLRTLGIDLAKLQASYDDGFFKRHKLTLGLFYDQASYGRPVLLPSGIPGTKSAESYSDEFTPGQSIIPPEFAETLANAPLSKAQRAKLREILAVSPKAKTYFKGASGKQRFFQQSYVQFLQAVYAVDDPALIALLSMSLADDSAIGGTGVSLPAAVEGGFLGLPPEDFFAGWEEDEGVGSAGGDEEDADPRADEEDEDEDEDHAKDEADGEDDEGHGIYHFPDGNATIARLLVKRLIPEVARFASAEQCVTARFDYRQLDRPGAMTSIRLGSLAVHADNTANGTVVRYLRDGKLFEAQSRHAVMAGWHMMAAHIMPSLPVHQKAAMQANVKMPLVYVQVTLRQWAPIKKSGVGAAYCPSSWFQFVQMEFPVSAGSYKPRRTPDSPLNLLLVRMPCPLLGTGPISDQLKQGRADLLATSFETFEARIREQLESMYGRHGFNAERDISAITVNRWPHGYVFEDARYKGKPAHLQARRLHGRIAIANADAAGRAYTDAAIDMAWRAVQELKSTG